MSSLSSHDLVVDINYGTGKDYVSWGIICLVIALIAAALGFGGLAGTTVGAAKIVFVVGVNDFSRHL